MRDGRAVPLEQIRVGHRSEAKQAAALHAALFRVAAALVGGRFAAMRRELEGVQWLPMEELRARQEARLAPLLRTAAESVPFYRETYRGLGLAPAALSTVADLARLPIVSKSTHRQHPPGHFLAVNVPAHRRIEDRTSGSTGEPFRFFTDRQSMTGVLASHLLFDTWYGIRTLDRNTRIQRPGVGTAPPRADLPLAVRLHQRMITGLKASYMARTQQRISVWDVDEEQAEAIYRQIEAFHPHYIHGYASTLAALADLLLRRQLRLSHPVRAVINFAETLTPPRRRLIERYFQAPIINRYGMREIGSYFAQSCPVSPDRFHVNTERVVWETLRADGTPAAPGEVGRVVVTALDNYVMPFIRYDTGDLAVAGGEPCPCGRGLPLVGPVDGRSAECLCTPAGRVISPVALAGYLVLYHDHVDTVRQYQLWVEAAGCVRLLIVPAPALTVPQREQLGDDLTRLLTKLLGAEMTVVVEMVKDIPTEPSGKRLVIKQAEALYREVSHDAL